MRTLAAISVTQNRGQGPTIQACGIGSLFWSIETSKKGGAVANDIYDIIAVGGGLGGASLARAMADHGARVLVLEREEQFKDRVRGENMWPWGEADLKELGCYELLQSTCDYDIVWFDVYLGSALFGHRDIIETTPQHLPGLNFYHPAMQEVLLQAAAEAGAEVRRGSRVRSVQPGALPAVTVEREGRAEDLHARLIVCADGRASLARTWAGFEVHHDQRGMMVAGVMFEEMSGPDKDSNYLILAPSLGQAVFLTPQGGPRTRAYLVYSKQADYRLHTVKDLPRFIAESLRVGAPEKWYQGVRPISPLASFDGSDSWVEHPYREGVALVGDAAAASDPSYGQGLSLTVRDVRVLRDCLLDHDDWDAAGHVYAEEHDRYYGALHRATGWFWQLFYETGPAADLRRAKAFPLLAEDRTRMPDFLLSGPEVSLDETVRRRFFGEE
jgi:2-polyprenyl-6-methoxyphenol hydroxylase-like FAD-dependent oxidoreductase